MRIERKSLESRNMGLTIQNQTDWDGRKLRSLCRLVIDETDGWRNRSIDVKTSKSNGKDFKWERLAERTDDRTVGTTTNLYRGRASIGTRRYCYMGVPKVERKVNGDWYRHSFDPIQFARVLEHELAHQRGLRHGDMTDDLRYCKQEIEYPVDEIEVVPKPNYEFEGDY